jgi:hypothetical protein
VGGLTAALSAALEHVGGLPPTPDRLLDLCVDDRRWLMQQLMMWLGIRTIWTTSVCDGCGTPFDVGLDPRRLAVKPAGEGFPFAEAVTSRAVVTARVPSGRDQRAVGALPDGEAERALVRRCIESGADAVADDELELVAAALEEVSPEVTRSVESACPACGREQALAVESHAGLEAGADRLLEDVHGLASTYHWSERDILELPRHRRRRYLAMTRRDVAV